VKETVRFHRNPGRHRAPDPRDVAFLAALHEPATPQPQPLSPQGAERLVRETFGVLGAAASAAETTAPLHRITDATEPILPQALREPLPIPSRERVAEAMDALRLGTPARPFDGIVQQAAPLPAVHEGLPPAAVPHLPRVRVVARTEDTVTLAVLGPPRPPALPTALPVVRPPAPLVKRIPRHVPPQVLPTGQARMRALYTRMWEDLNDAHGRTMSLHQDAAKAAAVNDERAAQLSARLSRLTGRHRDLMREHGAAEYASQLAQHATRALTVAGAR
jgi:hypothetical protein